MQPINKKYFSPKQLTGIKNCKSFINLFCGAVRSGKTHSSYFISIYFILKKAIHNRHPVAFIGKTFSAAERNLLLPMQFLFGRSNVTWNRSTGRGIVCGKEIVIFGANNKAAVEKIQGVTLSGAICDEVTLFPEEFFMMLISRLSIEGAQLFGTCNPESPFHYLKTNFIDKENELNLYHLHFELDDNLTLTDSYKNDLRTMYSGVFYKRFILGEWVIADGLIYSVFKDKNIIEGVDRNHLIEYSCGVDDGTTNPFAAVILAKYSDDNKTPKWAVVDELYYDSKKHGSEGLSDQQKVDKLKKFLFKYGKIPVVVDPSAKSFRICCGQSGVNTMAANNDVMHGIQFTLNAFDRGVLNISKRLTNTLGEIYTYAWDEKKALLGIEQPIKTNDHLMDALRYVFFTLYGRSPVHVC